jgi:cyclic pyranopterin phosphate synthase
MFKEFLPSLLGRPKTPAAPAPKAVGIANPGVRIVDGKILPHYACQADIVNQCNLACRDCDHISPIARNRFANPDTLYRDFSMLAKVYKPQLVQLLGGEPLLHPDIVTVIKAVRASGISDRVMVLTNGLLLSRMNDEFWESLDDLEISIYPDSNLDRKLLENYQAKATEHGVRLEIYYYKEFRRHFSLAGTQDQALVERIYRSCKKVHVWGCHSIYEGHIYKCPQSIFIPGMLGLAKEQHSRDGLKLRDSADFLDELYRFLTSPEPLQACRNCLSCAGIMRPHTQVRPRDWLAHHDGPLESMVDYAELRRIEAEMHIQKPDHIKELLEAKALDGRHIKETRSTEHVTC